MVPAGSLTSLARRHSSFPGGRRRRTAHPGDTSSSNTETRLLAGSGVVAEPASVPAGTTAVSGRLAVTIIMSVISADIPAVISSVVPSSIITATTKRTADGVDLWLYPGLAHKPGSGGRHRCHQEVGGLSERLYGGGGWFPHQNGPHVLWKARQETVADKIAIGMTARQECMDLRCQFRRLPVPKRWKVEDTLGAGVV